MNDIILKIENVRKSFVRNIINKRGQEEDERFHIIDDLDLMVPRGKITALIGGNGAGKTTLFNIVSGLIRADAGDIIYQSNPEIFSLNRMPAYKITRLGIGRLFQGNHIFQDLTVLENMLIGDNDTLSEQPQRAILRAGQKKSTEQIKVEKTKQIFNDLFDLDNPFWGKRNDLAKELSYGQQRLLGLARLFMGDYNFVLLDEPTAGVNPVIIHQTMNIIRKMVAEKGMSVLLIEHNMKVVLDVSDFCSFMSHGKITAFGTPDDVIGNDQVRKTYLGI